jgi:hypothetical protein
MLYEMLEVASLATALVGGLIAGLLAWLTIHNGHDFNGACVIIFAIVWIVGWTQIANHFVEKEFES